MYVYIVLVIASGCVVYYDVTRRHIDNKLVTLVGLLALSNVGVNQIEWLQYLVAMTFGLFVFAIRAFAGGDVKLMLAYLLGINSEWWPTVMMIITGLGGVMALAYLLYGYVSNNMKAIRQKGLPYGVPIAIGGCLGVLLSMS